MIQKQGVGSSITVWAFKKAIIAKITSNYFHTRSLSDGYCGQTSALVTSHWLQDKMSTSREIHLWRELAGSHFTMFLQLSYQIKSEKQDKGFSGSHYFDQSLSL